MVGAFLSRLFIQFNLYLGHGRGLEVYFALVMMTWGFQIFWSPEALWQSLALRDYYLTIQNHYVGAIVFTAGFTSSTGLALNIAGIGYCRFFRMAGALLSLAIWLFMLSNIFQETGGYGGVVPWYLWAIPANARLFYLGILNLPRPGARGQFEWPPTIP